MFKIVQNKIETKLFYPFGGMLKTNNLNKSLIRSLITTTMIGILGGISPATFWKTPLFSSPAVAQSFSEELVRNYAQAILKIEPYREKAYNDIQQMIGTAPPEIICSEENSWSNLPPDAQELAQNYCKTSKEIVESSGLSVSQFNEVTRSAANDNNLKTQIQEAIRQIQE
ncbi:MAG: DUF4168 domain-containing protein [Gomphosphaeria aponina SAG 52.96 = DSM 107014]|uniref:DUF4168 domain-containing protein n=1 Tax=Gomphosphaeria aponina SAG 52.96 = DSM 107014 TaxID=1521640 RepID=A0A941JN58_9CHRO|nr:DUF4168 domain-containing protein [Gomphosphaeria aponina SAG 52.96 = DSM 107014]